MKEFLIMKKQDTLNSEFLLFFEPTNQLISVLKAGIFYPGTLRPGTRDSETQDLDTRNPETWDPENRDPGTMRTGTWDPGTLGPQETRAWHPGPWKWDPRTLRVATDPTTD